MEMKMVTSNPIMDTDTENVDDDVEDSSNIVETPQTGTIKISPKIPANLLFQHEQQSEWKSEPTQLIPRPRQALSPNRVLAFDVVFGALCVWQPSPPCAFIVEQKRTRLEAFGALMAAHVMSGGQPQYSLSFSAMDAPTTAELWQQLNDSHSFVQVKPSNTNGDLSSSDNSPPSIQTMDRSSHELILVPAKPLTFLIYALPLNSSPELLNNYQIALVLGMENTLLRCYDLERVPPPREAELAMLMQFDQLGQVQLGGGHVINAELEESVLDEGDSDLDPKILEDDAVLGQTNWRPSLASVIHPVLELHSAQGTVVFTKIPHQGKLRSYIVHVRPFWQDFRAYLLGKQAAEEPSPLDPSSNGNSSFQNSSSSSSSTPSSSPPTNNTPSNLEKSSSRSISSSSSRTFRLHVVAKHAKGSLALELWRLLDREFSLLSREQVRAHLVRGEAKLSEQDSVRGQTMNVSLALGGEFCGDTQFATVCVDDSSRWVGGELVWPVRAYDPYFAPVDTGLRGALDLIHDLRNDFFATCDSLRRAVGEWIQSHLDQIEASAPKPPSTRVMLAFLKHRRLQEYQATMSRSVPPELEAAKDYLDPALRNKHHLVIDTNALLLSASDGFVLFEELKRNHLKNIVIVMPYATISELDWQKHNAKDQEKKIKAQLCIRFIQVQAASHGSFLVIQSEAEDTPSRTKHEQQGQNLGHNSKNDLRILDTAHVRCKAGLRAILVTGDVNLRNLAMSNGVPAVRAQGLWKLLCNRDTMRLDPSFWVDRITRSEAAKAEKQFEASQASKRARPSALEE